MATSTISAFVSGDYLAPPDHRLAGQRIVAVAYLIRHPDAVVLFDTGFPFDAEFSVTEGEVELVTYPRSVDAALRSRGSSLDGVDLVVNCHLHVDHAGGNFRLPATTPIHVQARELADASADEDPIVRDALAIGQQAYRPLEGEVELLDGVRVVPTPGHTPGHQSLMVDTDDGPVFLAGQAMQSASDFAVALYARRLEREGSDRVPPYPDWLPRIEELAPVRAMFAHDLAAWEGRLAPG